MRDPSERRPDRRSSKRKQAEGALRENEERYRQLIDSVHDWIWEIDEHGRYRFASPKVVELLGYEAEEVLGKTPFDLMPPDEASRVADLFTSITAKREPFRDLVNINQHKDGRLVFLETSGMPMFDSNGDYRGYRGMDRDITERKQAEELLKDEASGRRVLLEQSKDGIVVIDQRGKVYEANEAYARMLGYTMEEIYQLHIWDWDTTFSKEELLLMLATPYEGNANIETRFRRKDGTLCDVEISINGTTYGDERFGICVCRDITERKQADEALRESHERFQLANRATYNAIWDWDLRTDALWWNETFQALFGYAPEEIEPGIESWTSRIHPDELDRVAAGIHAAIDSGQQFWSDQYRFRSKDGTYADIEDRGYISRDSAGTPIRMIGAMRDITTLVQAEEERLQLERRAQESQRLESLGVLAGGIAHDFNNILTSVLGNAELALSELSPAAPARENLLEISQASRRAAALCRQMLAYSGRGAFVTEAIDLGALVEDMLDLLKSTISKKALLNLNLGNNLPSVLGDASQISQVIMNLVMNASEAIGERSGVITISTGATECSPKYLKETYADENLAPGLYLTLEVSDTGVGMDKTTREHLFEPFFTTKFTGRGLGLSAVLGIVRGHRGALRLYSELSKGTTFKILFPVSETDTESLARTNGTTARDWRGEGTVLLVDDEETIRTLGSRMLASLGFTVLTAADGREALSVYVEHRDEISLVLLDLTMPHMDGEQTFRELRLIDPEVRVVMSSGYTASDITARFAGKGLVGFVHKPYSLTELAEQLREALTPRPSP